MPWKECDRVSQRQELMALASPAMTPRGLDHLPGLISQFGSAARRAFIAS